MQGNKIPMGWVFGGVGVLALVLFIGGFVGANNYAVRAERQIQATWENNTNILGTYTTKISEMAQVPGMQTDALKEVMKAAFEGRYGDNGSRAAVQWIREAYPGQVDNSLYQRLMETMDAGRTEFRNNQTKLISQKAEYETKLGTLPDSIFLSLAGFPKKDLSKFNVVISSSAQKSFETGIDDGVKLRQAPAAPATAPSAAPAQLPPPPAYTN